jgi:hypothetical protein
VSALHQLTELHHEQKAPLVLRASDGTPVRVILDLVGLSTGPSERPGDLSSIGG